jgi:acyl-CoA hydrolase
MNDPQSPTPKTVAQSSVREQVYMVFPNDLNANDTVFGGLIMAHMDRLAAVVADRHAGGVTVTVSVDAVHFMAPARRGDVLVMHASVNRAWKSSMEIGGQAASYFVGLHQFRRSGCERPAGAGTSVATGVARGKAPLRGSPAAA